MYAYSEWSPCQINGTQTRTVTGSSPAGCLGSPQVSQSCVYAQPSPSATDPNYTALWWNPAESGWGINVNHQGNTLFATLFSYTASGAPMWLVASGLSKQPDGSYTGALYRATGPAFNRVPWRSSDVGVSQVGTMALQFLDNGHGSVAYTVNGFLVVKPIQRQVFSAPSTCTHGTGSRVGLTNYQDLWWNPEESGWGVNLTHQGNIVFATLFTYDGTGAGLWLVASALTRQSDGSFTGALYSTRGVAFNAAPWMPATANQVGSMTLRFANGETATLSYTVNGAAVTKTIQRQVFGDTTPRCNGGS
jgi:hypothetical protein